MKPQNTSIFFISRDATWQKYRNEVLTQLGRRHGYRTTVLTTGEVHSYNVESDVMVYERFRNLLPGARKASFFPGALLRIARKRPDVVLALPNASQLTEFVALPLCRLLRIPIVYWTHGADHFQAPAGLRGWLHRFRTKYILFFCRLADRLIAFSDGGKEYLTRHGVPEWKVTVAHNTLDTETMASLRRDILAKQDKTAIKEELGFPRDSRLLLYSGRLVPLKRVDFALRVQKLVHEQRPNTHFVVIGHGPEEEALSAQARVDNVPNVHFVGPLFDDEKLSRYFLASDLFLMPGYVGLAIIHAFSFGLPLITGNVVHSPEIQFFKPDRNGSLLDLNEERFARRIVELLDHPEELRALSEEALATAANEGNIHRMLSAVDEALQSAITSCQSGRETREMKAL